MPRCKACGAEIVWIRTPAGKSMPCDKEPVMYWQRQGAKGKVVTKNGEVLSCVFEGKPERATGMGFIPHWGTCAEANKFRNKKSPRQRAQK